MDTVRVEEPVPHNPRLRLVALKRVDGPSGDTLVFREIVPEVFRLATRTVAKAEPPGRTV